MTPQRFEGVQQPITVDQIRGIAERLSVQIPEDLIQHYLTHNGGHPVNSFAVFDGVITDLNCIFPMLFGEMTLETVFGWSREDGWLPGDLVAFGEDSFGNSFCFSTGEDDLGNIYWFEAENFEDPDEAAYYLTDSFRELMNKLVDRETAERQRDEFRKAHSHDG